MLRHTTGPAAVSLFLDPARVDAVLAPLVLDPQDRAWLVRCLIDTGPVHHRGVNYVLIALLAQISGPASVSSAAEVPVPLRSPPHLGGPETDASYPIGLPLDVLDRLAPRGSAAQQAMIDCLTDGPPQHALANAVMLHLLRPLTPGG